MTALLARTARSVRSRFTRRKIAVQVISGAFVLLGLVAGVAVGAMVNDDPAKAETPVAPVCAVMCEQGGVGGGSVGIAPVIGVGGSSGWVGEVPAP